ncbi:sulfatase-like hydrolase/transferase [Pigmentiphaga aceris]|uniref:Sulfatase-like hydrolase/transferase n=1 Tax=Pigmentiphaga aceris TaxID=1940612 RepID=A0A5C0AXV2_9BURK|nr:alkaline phosphatase family protein [Pigmentiphaga aceris]QEI05207.1 sulfatase-like hydrolase/transferase [Pigmentiphaga aceris]
MSRVLPSVPHAVSAAAPHAVSRANFLGLPTIQGRASLALLVWQITFVCAFAARVLLSALSLSQDLIGASMLPRIFISGALMDAITGLYLVLPFAVYLWLAPRRLYQSRVGRAMVFAGIALTIGTSLYLIASEYFFFDEFNARFNYVAVEYLIYPTEVLTNIRDSYPVYKVLSAAVAMSLSLTWVLRARIRAAFAESSSYGSRTLVMGGVALVTAATLAGVNLQTVQRGHERVANELAANGIYAFFSAARNAHIDYEAYYATLSTQEAATRVRHLLGQNNTQPSGGDNPFARHVDNRDLGPVRKMNVIVLLQESMGSEFVGSLGGRGLTPNIDRIAAQGMSFTHLYASGTRTVRGMEAVTTSLAPVPPESVVKRTNNEGLFNLASIAKQAGYAPTFIYGGYGTFDNMNAFFGGNGWKVVDRTDMPSAKFANIWGIADEALMDNALDVFDKQVARGEQVFSVVMSTSNHKPFTFPAGIPGVAEKGGGRDAGVRYADYAIGHFFDKLQTRPWAKDTMLVIVADHGARVYGRAEVPVSTYEIPLVIHAPAYIQPQRIDTLASQIDVGPTILGLLHLSYDSRLPGRDILRMKPEDGYAVFNHNRDSAMMRGDRVATLGFGKTMQTEIYDPVSKQLRPAPHDPQLESDAQALFQTSQQMFVSGLQKE